MGKGADDRCRHRRLRPARPESGRLLLARLDPGDVVLLTRSPETLAAHAERGAAVRRADFDDLSSLVDALRGRRMLLISAVDLTGEPRSTVPRSNPPRRRACGTCCTRRSRSPSPGHAAAAPSHLATEQAVRDSGLEWTFLRNNLYAEFQVPVVARAIGADGSSRAPVRGGRHMSRRLRAGGGRSARPGRSRGAGVRHHRPRRRRPAGARRARDRARRAPGRGRAGRRRCPDRRDDRGGTPVVARIVASFPGRGTRRPARLGLECGGGPRARAPGRCAMSSRPSSRTRRTAEPGLSRWNGDPRRPVGG